MITKKIRRGRRRCIIYVGEVNVIIAYIVPLNFVIIKYSPVILYQFFLKKVCNWELICIKIKWGDR